MRPHAAPMMALWRRVDAPSGAAQGMRRAGRAWGGGAGGGWAEGERVWGWGKGRGAACLLCLGRARHPFLPSHPICRWPFPPPVFDGANGVEWRAHPMCATRVRQQRRVILFELRCFVCIVALTTRPACTQARFTEDWHAQARSGARRPRWTPRRRRSRRRAGPRSASSTTSASCRRRPSRAAAAAGPTTRARTERGEACERWLLSPTAVGIWWWGLGGGVRSDGSWHQHRHCPRASSPFIPLHHLPHCFACGEGPL